MFTAGSLAGEFVPPRSLVVPHLNNAEHPPPPRQQSELISCDYSAYVFIFSFLQTITENEYEREYKETHNFHSRGSFYVPQRLHSCVLLLLFF